MMYITFELWVYDENKADWSLVNSYSTKEEAEEKAQELNLDVYDIVQKYF